MAEEGTLGLAHAHEPSGEELSKELLQRRMDDARESISQTVTEIKESVVHQYETVKETISETLDWREQFKKRPVAWVAGAAGAGFLTGYCVTAMVKGDSHDSDRYSEDYGQARYEYQTPSRANYAAQPLAASAVAAPAEDEGPGLLTRLQETQAFDRLKNEASTIGDNLVNEVSKTAKEILVPAIVGFVKHWLEGLIPKKATTGQATSQEQYNAGGVGKAAGQSVRGSSYQPVAESR